MNVFLIFAIFAKSINMVLLTKVMEYKALCEESFLQSIFLLLTF